MLTQRQVTVARRPAKTDSTRPGKPGRVTERRHVGHLGSGGRSASGAHPMRPSFPQPACTSLHHHSPHCSYTHTTTHPRHAPPATRPPTKPAGTTKGPASAENVQKNRPRKVRGGEGRERPYSPESLAPYSPDGQAKRGQVARHRLRRYDLPAKNRRRAPKLPIN